MSSNLPLILLGIGALWYITRDDEDDEFDEAIEFEEGFDPDEYEFSEDEYGFWWTKRGKARRRDRKRRRAARRMGRYKKCVKKKGRNHRKCKRIRKYAGKSLMRAEALDEKLAARGRVTRVSFDSSGRIRSKVGGKAWDRPTAIKRKAKAAVAETYADDLYDEGPDPTDVPARQAGSGGSSKMLIVGGLAVFSIGGFLIYNMTKKPKASKKRRKKKRRAPAQKARKNAGTPSVSTYLS